MYLHLPILLPYVRFIALLIICGIGLCIPQANSQFVEDPHIAALMNRWKNYNLEHSEMRGWRIQILASTDRRQIESVRRIFENRYREYPTHFVHNDPYYQLKVGAFISIQKAQAFLRKLQSDYPQAIPVTDELKKEELLLYDQ